MEMYTKGFYSLSEVKILALSKLEANADENFNVAQIMHFSP